MRDTRCKKIFSFLLLDARKSCSPPPPLPHSTHSSHTPESYYVICSCTHLILTLKKIGMDSPSNSLIFGWWLTAFDFSLEVVGNWIDSVRYTGSRLMPDPQHLYMTKCPTKARGGGVAKGIVAIGRGINLKALTFDFLLLLTYRCRH